MSEQARWDDGIAFVGLGQFHNVIFQSKDKNLDLYDHFVPLNGGTDEQNWILISFPNESDRFWTDEDLEWFEEQVVEDFDYEGIKASISLEFGAGFPRCVPACWYFTLSDKEAE